MADGTDVVFRPTVPARGKRPAGLLAFLWKNWRDPLTAYSEQNFTEPFVFFTGRGGASINVTDPAGVRHVLLDNAGNYEKGLFQRRVFGPLIASGLLLADGEDWRRARRILAPLFTPTKTFKLAADMKAVCERRVAAWPLPSDGAAILDIDMEMTRITFEIISETMFSNVIGGEAEEFERAFHGFVETTGRIDPLDLLGVPPWVPRLGKLAGKRYVAFFEKRVNRLIAERRAMIEGGDAPDDLLSALLRARDTEDGGALSEAEVSANVLTFIMAGHETTARALGWALHLVSRTPDVQARLRAEADAFDLADQDWQAAMPWTRAVLDETMRLYPPAPTTLRFPLQDDVICGQPIPAGTRVGISPYIIHRHKSLWSDPEAFRPERFLPGARETIDRFSFLPFSQGPRICIGASFAIQEALIALATILKAVEIEPTGEPEPMPSHRITLRAKNGIRLQVRRRS